MIVSKLKHEGEMGLLLFVVILFLRFYIIHRQSPIFFITVLELYHVLQGSVLGPVLYAIFVSPIFDLEDIFMSQVTN